jgi:hypothetical protein
MTCTLLLASDGDGGDSGSSPRGARERWLRDAVIAGLEVARPGASDARAELQVVVSAEGNAAPTWTDLDGDDVY